MPSDTASNIAAIDAGSNAIRLLIARAESPRSYRQLKSERVALRLGHRAFTEREFDAETLDQAVQVFRKFKSKMNQHDVQRYRAVATSAARDARNRKVLVDRIFRSSGIRLEVIEGHEEARLIRTAVLAVLERKVAPRLIMDLGGGSLQMSVLQARDVWLSFSLSIGTVRLMEKFEVSGAMSPEQVQLVRERVWTVLRRFLSIQIPVPARGAVVCGGNAEALALIAPGAAVRGIPTIDFTALRRKAQRITRASVPERMNTFLVRKDRAEVMGIASIVFGVLAQWWGLQQALVPGVGVKEGVLWGLLHSIYNAESLETPGEGLVEAARRFAARLSYDAPHCEKVRELAVSLFDQLQPLHGLDREVRPVLEIGAILHDIGHAVGRESHHKMGESMVRHADIPGISEAQRDLAACLVRYHSEAGPQSDHKVYSSMPAAQQRQVLPLVALLRLADRLDSDHRQSVSEVRARIGGRQVDLAISMKRASALILWNAGHAADLFEEEFGRKLLLKPAM
jgi:exopolyphosphatase/guanosine-5'-triphosphate,3'-diphosphate pyrophosphatase